MTSYIIIAPPRSTLSDTAIAGKFDRWIAISPDLAWAVSTTHGTCSDVRDVLRAAPTDGATCVVVKAIDYNGHAARDLWEKLEVWAQGE